MLADVNKHRLTYPITHGARVCCVDADAEPAAAPLVPSTSQGATQLSIAEIATFRRLHAPANTSTSLRPEHSHYTEDSEVPLTASS